ncbi:MAG: pilus assembly protein TadG-related protein [Planctomycetota bacterium]|jgi:Flp pilus assembly protein TadG
MWVVIFGTSLMLMLGFVIEAGNIWLGRVELIHALEAGALAGAKVWGDGADDAATRSAARLAAQEFAQANTVTGATITVSTNDNMSGLQNDGNNNLMCDGDVVLGGLTGGVFSASAANPMAANERAVLVRGSFNVTGITSLFNPPYVVTGQAIARADGTGAVRLVEVTTINCP